MDEFQFCFVFTDHTMSGPIQINLAIFVPTQDFSLSAAENFCFFKIRTDFSTCLVDMWMRTLWITGNKKAKSHLVRW